MRVTRLTENMFDACAEFWWSLYRDTQYVHRPDGYQTLNTDPIGPQYFLKYLDDGLSNDYPDHWQGRVTDDSIVIAENGGKIEGVLVSAIDRDKQTGSILSAYVSRDAQGRKIAECMLVEALNRFRDLGLRGAKAAPGGRSMEVECPIHLALLQSGFGWEGNWDPACPDETYGVFLGGSLAQFSVDGEIHRRAEQLKNEGIKIERVERNHFPSLRRLDTGDLVDSIDDRDANKCAFVALVDGLAVGWTFEVMVFEDEGRKLCKVGPEVIPSYRRRGIAKILHHLGIEEAVRRGATGGWTATGIFNPARIIYHSVGWRYWYTSFGNMSTLL